MYSLPVELETVVDKTSLHVSVPLHTTNPSIPNQRRLIKFPMDIEPGDILDRIRAHMNVLNDAQLGYRISTDRRATQELLTVEHMGEALAALKDRLQRARSRMPELEIVNLVRQGLLSEKIAWNHSFVLTLYSVPRRSQRSRRHLLWPRSTRLTTQLTNDWRYSRIVSVALPIVTGRVCDGVSPMEMPNISR